MRIRIVIQKGLSQAVELRGSRKLGLGQPFPPACTLRSRQRLAAKKEEKGSRYPEGSRDKGLPRCPLKDGGATSDSDWPAPGSAPEEPTWTSYHRRLDLGWTQGAKELLQGVRRGGWSCEHVCGAGRTGKDRAPGAVSFPSSKQTVLCGLSHGSPVILSPLPWGLKPSPLPMEGTGCDRGTLILILVLRQGSYDLSLIHSSFQLLSLLLSPKGL